MPLRAVDQMALDERVIEDKTIEQALELRLERREALAEVRAESKEADDAATAALTRLELPVGGVARVGRFRISKELRPARSVAFETEPKVRVSVTTVDDA